METGVIRKVFKPKTLTRKSSNRKFSPSRSAAFRDDVEGHVDSRRACCRRGQHVHVARLGRLLGGLGFGRRDLCTKVFIKTLRTKVFIKALRGEAEMVQLLPQP